MPNYSAKTEHLRPFRFKHGNPGGGRTKTKLLRDLARELVDEEDPSTRKQLRVRSSKH